MLHPKHSLVEDSYEFDIKTTKKSICINYMQISKKLVHQLFQILAKWKPMRMQAHRLWCKPDWHFFHFILKPKKMKHKESFKNTNTGPDKNIEEKMPPKHNPRDRSHNCRNMNNVKTKQKVIWWTPVRVFITWEKETTLDWIIIINSSIYIRIAKNCNLS